MNVTPAFQKLLFSGLLLFTLALTSQTAYSQTHSTTTADQKIDAVYGSGYFEGKPELKSSFVKLLNERIVFEQIPGVAPEKSIFLSTVGYTKMANATNIIPLENFNPSTFNPLVYNIPFFSWDRIYTYRIDGTDYFMTIKPQTH